MDEQFRLPGTKFRFGIDPIINLFPGDPMHYSTAAHQTAFFVMIGFQLVAFVYCVWPRRSIIPVSGRQP